MKLKFFGRGAGFTTIKEGHTSAYFEYADKLVLIDCPMTTFFKLEEMDLSKYNSVDILITHTHADHISGLGLFIQFCKFVKNLPVVVIAPSDRVKKDLVTVLSIEGNEDFWYEICEWDVIRRPYIKRAIATSHSPQLSGKCYGYALTIEETPVVYTGDTGKFEDFKNDILTGSEFYADTSVYYGQIHLKLEDMLEEYKILENGAVDIYLMHLDDVNAAKKIIENKENIHIVEIGN